MADEPKGSSSPSSGGGKRNTNIPRQSPGLTLGHPVPTFTFDDKMYGGTVFVGGRDPEKRPIYVFQPMMFDILGLVSDWAQLVGSASRPTDYWTAKTIDYLEDGFYAEMVDRAERENRPRPIVHPDDLIDEHIVIKMMYAYIFGYWALNVLVALQKLEGESPIGQQLKRLAMRVCGRGRLQELIYSFTRIPTFPWIHEEVKRICSPLWSGRQEDPIIFRFPQGLCLNTKRTPYINGTTPVIKVTTAVVADNTAGNSSDSLAHTMLDISGKCLDYLTGQGVYNSNSGVTSTYTSLEEWLVIKDVLNGLDLLKSNPETYEGLGEITVNETMYDYFVERGMFQGENDLTTDQLIAWPVGRGSKDWEDTRFEFRGDQVPGEEWFQLRDPVAYAVASDDGATYTWQLGQSGKVNFAANRGDVDEMYWECLVFPWDASAAEKMSTKKEFAKQADSSPSWTEIADNAIGDWYSLYGRHQWWHAGFLNQGQGPASLDAGSTKIHALILQPSNHHHDSVYADIPVWDLLRRRFIWLADLLGFPSIAR